MSQTVDDDAQSGGRFPFIPLRRAIERAREIYAVAGDHAVPIADAIKLWGYSEKASGWRQTVAALKYYGIMESSGTKDGRKVKLTADGRRYFLDERPEKHAELHRKFALAPAALGGLWNLWRARPPADQIARSTLKVDFHYGENSAGELLAVYKDNLEFAALADGGADSPGAGDPPAPAPSSEKAPEHPAASPATPAAKHPTARHTGKVQIMDGERELTTGLLSKDGASFRLIVSGQVGEKEIDRLIRKLEIDKEILAETSTFSVSVREQIEFLELLSGSPLKPLNRL